MKPNSKYLIVGLGEILWDIFPEGKRLGGAPANFVYYVSKLGHDGIIVSRIGNDLLGQEILKSLNHFLMKTCYIQIDNINPTGIVNVRFDDIQKPKYQIANDVAWDYIEWNNELKDLANKVDAVCFGTIAQRSQKSRRTIVNFLENVSKNAIKIFDINLRQNFYTIEIIKKCLELSTILKLNKEELRILSDLFCYSNISDLEIIKALQREFNLELICLTKGQYGSSILSKNELVEHSAYKCKVIDTVGVGDAFTAAVIVEYLNNSTVYKISEVANRLSSYVATQLGAIPVNST